ncbi:MAG: hypothetical protein V1800_11600, partial [Candidatus Latescibacterota bacterium]
MSRKKLLLLVISAIALVGGVNALVWGTALAQTPSISSVSPNPVTGSNSAQPFTIYGSNFVSGCNVTLRVGGSTYANRTISSFSSTQIVINPIFTTTPATWTAQVINPNGTSSGQYSFQVIAPQVDAATFVSETIPDGTTFGPTISFTKTWTFRNS